MAYKSAKQQRKMARPIMENKRDVMSIPKMGPGLMPKMVDKKAQGAARNKIDAHK